MKLLRWVILVLGIILAALLTPVIAGTTVILPSNAGTTLAICGSLLLVLLLIIVSTQEKEKALEYLTVGVILFLFYHFLRHMLPPCVNLPMW